MSWKPTPRTDVDVRTLPLTPRLGFLLSRLDGASDVKALAALVGATVDDVHSMLQQLANLGAITAPPTEPEPEAEAEADVDPGTHRQRYMTVFANQPAQTRAAAARTATDGDLTALCFDPLPEVVKELLVNAHTGLAHARLIARHHHTAAGLDALASRAAFAADLGVRRALSQNPQLPAAVFRRLWQARRLLELAALAASRDLPEGTRRSAREVLRQRFATAPAEERVELLLKTEGRCLSMLSGLGVDGKTTTLLCQRPITSHLLVQNIAHWSAAPPPLLVHLLRQDVVRHSPQLKLLISRHPNAP